MKEKMRYKLMGKVKTIDTEEDTIKKVNFFLVGKEPVYTAILKPFAIDRCGCDIVLKDTGTKMYENHDIRVFDNSSLIRCISIFTNIMSERTNQ